MKPSEINQGVFVELKATHKRKSAIQTFVDKEHFMNSSQESRLLLEEYTETVIAMQRELNLASLLEELIMLHRAKNNIKNLKISFVREYIYVRMHCYRPDNGTNDLRVIMGTTYQHGDKVEALYANSDFMSKANEKMESQIDEMIELKRNELNQFSGISTSETYN